MAMWRCPHCSTPQAEASRCWVCHRSTTACSTCKHFRRSVAAQLGYCGLDRKRQPLVGTEIRACWESGGVAETTGEAVSVGRASTRFGDDRGGTFVRKRDFVEVRSESVEDTTLRSSLVADHSAIESRWSLWGEPDS